MDHNLETTTAMLVASGKGILAADETVSTLTKRFETLGIRSTEEVVELIEKCFSLRWA
jgi:fructose-bisphosphate aldolase, class I